MFARHLLLALALLVPLHSQDPFHTAHLALRSMAIEEGLPSSRVHATLRDRHGRLWVGTQNGAAYLGGAGWTPLPLPREASSNYIRAMAETADGALWFGTEAGGLWRWRKGAWRHWAGSSESPIQRVNALLADGDTLWIGTAGAGLHKLKGDTLERVPGPSEPWIWTLATIPDGKGRPQLWVGGEKQVWVQEPEGWRQLGAREGWWKGGANCIVARREGGRLEVWVGSWGMGVGRWDPATQQFHPQPDFPSKNPTCITRNVRPDGSEDLWVGTYDSSLFRKTAEGWEPLGLAQGFPVTGVYCLLSNPEGRPVLWAGTRGAGLVAVDPAGWRSLPDDPRLPSQQANCFLETRDAADRPVFWIGTDKGLVRWDAKGPRVETSAQGLPGDFVTDLMEIRTAAGTELWASTIGGLARRRGQRWEAFGKAQGLTFYRVQCLASDLNEQGHARIYAGADGGLVCFEEGAWRQYGTADGLPNSIVTSLLAARNREGRACLWVGTRGGGLARLTEGRWQVFGTREGLPNTSIYGMTSKTAPNGRHWLWVATLGGGGLARLDMDQPERGFQTWDPLALPGLVGLSVQGISGGLGEALFLTTSSGVVKLDLQGPNADPVRVHRFTVSDGLPSLGATGGQATFLDRLGRVWVGTTKGIAALDATASQAAPTPPQPLIERITVQGRELDPDAAIVLGFRDKRLRIAFSLPVSHRHEAIEYRTQLLGLEAEPGEWTLRNDRDFTTLPARSYILRVWAKDGLGQDAPPVDLPFTVTPAPWFTWWARTLEGLALVGLVSLAVSGRQRALRQRTRELERLVSERTQELATANEALHTRSLTDPLTGLKNRRSLDESMGEIMGRFHRSHPSAFEGSPGGDRDLAFLILDLDHFKWVNDTYGHRAGDLVLQQVATVLQQTLRDTDRIVRWGGEEFLVVAVDTQLEEIPVLAERLRLAVSQHPFDLGQGEVIQRTVSLGFTCLPLFPAQPDLLGWEQAVNLADQCLYQAKAEGRDRWIGLLPRLDGPPGAVPPGMEAATLVREGRVLSCKLHQS